MDSWGCWFCRKTGGEDLYFTFEWDSDVHESCTYREAELGNPEALIILREWGELSQEEIDGRINNRDD